MPGLCGFINLNEQMPLPELAPMLGILKYNRATVVESYQDEGIAMGCGHLGTGGQQALYQSSQVAVLFFGYLTQPAIPPGADESDPAVAARHIHDRYLVRGEAVLDEVSGAFAIALWDLRNQTLLLANDHLGLRPIYYAEHAGSLRFASEVKGLLSDSTFPRRLNQSAVADLLYYSIIMGEKTFFEDIRMLPPASFLRYRDGRWEVSNYWDIPFPESYPSHPDKWYDELIYNALKDAAKRMVRPELRYGLSLSGGLDSRWIAAFLAQDQPESLAFTLGTPGSDDTPYAKDVAALTNMRHHYWEMSASFVAELGETYAYIVDGMDNLWHMEEFPLTVRVGDYADVSVGGFLGDGLFGYEMNPISARLRKQDALRYRLWRTRGSHPSQELMSQVFGERTGQELSALALKSMEETFAAIPSDRGFQTLQYYDLRQAERRYANLAQLGKLSRAYRSAMATYFPELAEIPWTFTLTPPTISVPGVMLKKATQLTLGKWLQGTSLGRHPLIRRRQYYVNYHLWSRGTLRAFIENTLLSQELDATGLFDLHGLRTILSDHMEGRTNITGFLGKTLAIALWTHQFYIPSTPLRPDGLNGDD
jgi:asparagine synthetase B (glutamine-hydrolysing)